MWWGKTRNGNSLKSTLTFSGEQYNDDKTDSFLRLVKKCIAFNYADKHFCTLQMLTVCIGLQIILDQWQWVLLWTPLLPHSSPPLLQYCGHPSPTPLPPHFSSVVDTPLTHPCPHTPPVLWTPLSHTPPPTLLQEGQGVALWVQHGGWSSIF